MPERAYRAASDPSEISPGYHQNWYPLCFSSEINNGAVVGKDFLGGRVVIYREETGKVVVQTAYCRHLGADLSLGKLVEGRLRCPFHHWQYDAEGKCVKIPTGDRPPVGARLFTYPSAEKWDLVWAFNGEEPLFELPSFPEITEEEMYYQTRSGGSWPVAPWLLVANTVDFQHLRTLHQITTPEEPDQVVYSEYGLGYDVAFYAPGLGDSTLHLRVFGTNTFTISGIQLGMEVYSMFTARELPSGGSEAFTISGTRNTNPTTTEEQQMLQTLVEINAALVSQIMEEDRPIITTMRFREGLLVASDRQLARYFSYSRKFARADPAQPYL
jgi:phenylpropionate dioxygenase-like ring-hydroxylating dioxygenase large terminal subunit